MPSAISLCYDYVEDDKVGNIVNSGLEIGVSSTALDALYIGIAVMVVATVYMALHKHYAKAYMLYGIITLSVVIFFAIGLSASLLQTQADSFGRQHRQIGLEFWVCGTEIQPALSNGLFSSTLGDKQFYLDEQKQLQRSGFVMDELPDASLGKFFSTAGGAIQSDSLILPIMSNESDWLMPDNKRDGDLQGNLPTEFLERYVNAGRRQTTLELSSGQRCHDGSTAELQVFAFRISDDGATYYQEKLSAPDDYVIPISQGDVSDCVIIEYASSKERTNKLCEHIGLRDSRRCSEFRSEDIGTDDCYLTETRPSGEAL